MVDLHVHSTCSDGTFTPEELVDYAMEKGLRAFALTDHDTVNGLTGRSGMRKGCDRHRKHPRLTLPRLRCRKSSPV